jgi:rare lipoprotein A (peptidoglycan hydrolase)
VVKINDTGNFAKYGRVIDMSRGSFAKLASPDAGVIRVCLTIL